MKKFMTLVSIFFLFLFMLGCTRISYKSQSNTTVPNKASKTEISSENSIQDYIRLLGKPEKELFAKYGEPSIKDTLYGGDFDYYEDYSIGFGIDGGMISSLFLYKGEIEHNIGINTPLNEIVDTLKLAENDVHTSDEFPQYIVYSYEGHECYLVFYDEILQEIIIK